MANSKLLLLKDVESLGRSGDIVSVRKGYARNLLIPTKSAVVADANAIRKQTKLQEERKLQAAKDLKESEELALKMVGIEVTKSVKVDHDGHMYGSVSAQDVAELILDQHKIQIEKRQIQIKHPIKEVGVFELPIKLKEGVTSSVTVKVTAEEPVHG